MEAKFQIPESIQIDQESLTAKYGRFTVEPLERGFAITLGNALRRVLLSSIEGAAIQSVRIDGVYHEFSTIPGVLEDVSEIVLNLKEVRVRLYKDTPKQIFVEKKGKSELVAGDLDIDPQIEVVNPQHHIATLNEEAQLRMELTFAKGWGYRPHNENKSPDQPEGTIAVDSIFSPVRKVNYRKENTRVGGRAGYEKLVLEIWTDGTIRPENALVSAAKLIQEHLKLFTAFGEQITKEEQRLEGKTDELEKKLKTPVDELKLPSRVSNCLHNAGIKTLGNLVEKTEEELLNYKNLGKKSLEQLNNALEQYGLSLGMDREVKNAP